ncbi:putative ribonuclease H-like domain-containing protein [Tanacetum coccineum]
MLPAGSISTWDLLEKAFIMKFCLPLKTAKKLEEIRNFKQGVDETLYQAWERYNDLLFRCPQHDLNNHQKVQIFYKDASREYSCYISRLQDLRRALQNQPPPKENDPGSFTLSCLIVDFVIMDMVEDPNVPLILGRPLLATAHAQIDVFNKQISLGVGEEKILFKMNELGDDPYLTYESVCKIECSRETQEEELKLLLVSNPQSFL